MREGGGDVGKREIAALADKLSQRLTMANIPHRFVCCRRSYQYLRFHLRTPGPLSKIERLADDLAVWAGVKVVYVSRAGKYVVLDVARPGMRQLTFSDLAPHLTSDDLRCVVGVALSGSIVALDFSSPVTPHLSIAGTTGSGKTTLLLTLALQLLAKQDVGVLLLAPAVGRFKELDGARNLLAPVLSDEDSIGKALAWAVQEMDRRNRAGVRRPHLFLIVDELADVISLVPGAADRLTRLARRGREAGVHLIVATQNPLSALLGSLAKSNLSARIVGQVKSPENARVATGRRGSRAHLLLGRGDFLYSGLTFVHFQGPWVSSEEVQRYLVAGPQLRDISEELSQIGWQRPASPEIPLPVLHFLLERRGTGVSQNDLQNRFSWGVSRASRMMALLEELGLVGPYPGGRRKREVVADRVEKMLEASDGRM